MPAKSSKKTRSKFSSKTKKSKSKVSIKGRFSKVQMIVFAVVFALVASYVIVKSFADTTGVTISVNAPVIGIARGASTNDGYWLVGSDGGIFSEGTAPFYGPNSASQMAGSGVKAIAATTDDKGYYTVTTTGNVYAYGDATYYGGVPGNYAGKLASGFGEFIATIIPTYNDQGYWLVSNYGQVFSFGNAAVCAGYSPAISGVSWSNQITGGATVLGSCGFWAVGADGNVYYFGDAGHFGNPAAGAGYYLNPSSTPVRKYIVGIAATPSDAGYWLVGSDGGVFTAGNAGFYGSEGSTALAAPITGIANTSDGAGYWLSGQDGGVFAFGDALYKGRVVAPAPAPTPAPAPKPTPTSTTSAKSPTPTPTPTTTPTVTPTSSDGITKTTSVQTIGNVTVTTTTETGDYVTLPAVGPYSAPSSTLSAFGPGAQSALTAAGITPKPAGSLNFVTCTTVTTVNPAAQHPYMTVTTCKQ